MKIKYPRTYHVPWSDGKTSDDKTLKDMSLFNNKRVIVTEKIDGENITMYSDFLHARSIESKDHESRHLLKMYHASLAHNIPKGWRICGENIYAKHSIEYSELESYFLVFSVWNEENKCLNWNDTVKFVESLNINIVPVIYDGIYNEYEIKKLSKRKSKYGDIQEGYVIRTEHEFEYSEFKNNVAKFVRKNHVQTDKNWMRQIVVKNKLKK